MNPSRPDNPADIFSVSRLTGEFRQVLEGSFPLLWIEGEISNLSQPRSGHVYFSIKDAHAQIRCALFRNRANLLRLTPENGMQVLLRARVSLYEPRGDLQLIVEHMAPAGAGALHQAFEALKTKLEREGLFDPKRKVDLPHFPHRVGVITSSSGAALHDMLKVLATRFPALAVRVYPAQVQGDAAPQSLRSALALALSRRDCEVLVLARGGGSLEDLWAFNDERLARDISAATLPIVSAVGHETDFTIADFVADRRAPTPSAAAEMISPDAAAIIARFDTTAQRLRRHQQHLLETLAQRLDHVQRRLLARHPRQWTRQAAECLAALFHRIIQSQKLRQSRQAQALLLLRQRLLPRNPSARLERHEESRRMLGHQLGRAMRAELASRQQRLGALIRQLDAISPLRTLARGYAIARIPTTGVVVRDAAEVQEGTSVELLLNRGKLDVKVIKRIKN